MAIPKSSASLIANLLTWGLAFVLAAYGLLTYPLALATEIGVCTLLVVLVVLGIRWILRRYRSQESESADAIRPSPLALFLFVCSAVLTTQAILAQSYVSLAGPLNTTPGYGLVARLLHYSLVAAVVWLGPRMSHEAALGTAIMYTSTLYTPTFFTQEAAPPFVPLRALALVMLVTTLSAPSMTRSSGSIPRRLLSAFRSALGGGLSPAPALALILFVLIAVFGSYSPSDSMLWLLNLLTLFAFIWVVPSVIQSEAGWKRMAMLVILFSTVIPVALSVARLTMLSWQLGVWPVLKYRLALAELGSHNLIARSLVVGAPLLIAWATGMARGMRRIAWLALCGVTLLVFVTSKSWSGSVALVFATLFVAVLRYGRSWVSQWRVRRSNLGWHLLHVAVVVTAVLTLLVLFKLAPQARIGSVDGRMLGFQAALRAIGEHPLWGIGPGHSFLMSSYTSNLDWLVDTRITLDNPLLSAKRLANALPLHTHNLFLQIGRGIGLLGLGAFVWLLIDLFRFGLQTRSRLYGQSRILVTACLAGIVAALGWAMLDVMVVFSPFFSFPTWALVGLALAAPRAFSAEKNRKSQARDSSPRTTHTARSFHRIPRSVSHGILVLLLPFLVVTTVVVPLFGNWHYRTAFSAYQDYRWSAAVEELEHASRWEPLNAKYHELRGAALINLDRYGEAISAYQHALKLKRDYAPYLAQLGWLYWLQDDPEMAQAHFERAVEADPFEAWRDGLHADLGLVYAAQGYTEEAVSLFKASVELDPKLDLALYWVPELGAGGEFDVILDPVYRERSSSELDKRFLAHLGKAEYTPRLFNRSATGSPLSFHQVLDAVEADYAAAHAAGGREAPRLLASVAEAARLVGLHGRAERAYLAYQEAFPESVYGYRDLGTLYRGQGRLAEAQEMLEAAVSVSPRDTASWLGLAEAYLEQGLLAEAESALDTTYRLEPLDASLYEMRALLHQKTGEIRQAADALLKALAIEESIPNRLALGDLYLQLGEAQQGAEQCIEATEYLARTSPRPLDSNLWELGRCLARSTEDGLPREIVALGSRDPLVGGVLAGHIYRARGQYVPALEAYQAASEVRPDEAAPHFFAAETYQALGQPAAAAAAYRQAAHLDPLESLPLLALGRLQWGQGEREAALESYRAAVEATPGWGEAQVALGNAYLAMGDRERAERHYKLAQTADGTVREGLVYDFSAHLASAEIQAPGPEYVRNDYFAIDGVRRHAIFMHPQASARYVVEVPESSLLSFHIGTAPESWDKPGDGVDFAIYVESEGTVEQVFFSYIDPKQDEDARRWHSHTLDLSRYGGQEVSIVFETGAGPAGDDQFDWAGWGEARLVAQ